MSSVVAKQATQHIAHFIAAPDTEVPLTQGRAPPPHTHSPRRVLTAHSRPPRFPFFLFFFFFFPQEAITLLMIETVQISNQAAVTLLKHQKRVLVFYRWLHR